MQTTELEDLSEVSAIRKLDHRLAYKMKDWHNTDLGWYRYHAPTDTWTSHHVASGFDHSVTEQHVLNMVGAWRESGMGPVTIFACCCPDCATAEMQAFTRAVGNVSHGYWPECFEKVKAQIA